MTVLHSQIGIRQSAPGIEIMVFMPLGIYISVPFCRTKCTFCNFASGVAGKAVYARYVERVCENLRRAEAIAAAMGGRCEPSVDSIYLGGGTPTVLQPEQLQTLFSTVRQSFEVTAGAEVTVECAPGTLTPALLDSLLRCGVNRVSLGVQSFVDQEASGVGRLHSHAIVLDDIARLRAAGIADLSIDLIAGLPHQTADSWRYSLQETLATGVPHVSVYMLEVDDESRLGRELIAGGTRYHAHFVPDDDATADFYLQACEMLEQGGVAQYEISNFARTRRSDAVPRVAHPHVAQPRVAPPPSAVQKSRSDLPAYASRHNLKYWTRQPYLGFGVDAHSMLRATATDLDAIRWATADALEPFLAGAPLSRTTVTAEAAREEELFLGLRLHRGVPAGLFDRAESAAELAVFREAGLLEVRGDRVCLTARGRLLSNEVFQRFLHTEEQPQPCRP